MRGGDLGSDAGGAGMSHLSSLLASASASKREKQGERLRASSASSLSALPQQTNRKGDRFGFDCSRLTDHGLRNAPQEQTELQDRINRHKQARFTHRSPPAGEEKRIRVRADLSGRVGCPAPRRRPKAGARSRMRRWG